MRMARLALPLFAALVPQVSLAGDAYDRHVFFENSASQGGYYHSSASLVAPSKLEVVADKIPVEHNRSVSPPNALRLSWTSAPGGDWRATLKAVQQYGHRFDYSGDVLTLWCYSDQGLQPLDAPRVTVASSGGGLPTITLLDQHGPLPAKKWVRLEIPLRAFGGQYEGTSDGGFDPKRLASIDFVQGLDDNKPHTLYIDDVRLVPASSLDDTQAPEPPTGLSALGHERHFDLAWSAGAEEDLLGYRVYRSIEGSDGWAPVQTRPGSMQRCVDFVDGPDVSASYRVTALDLNGNESAPSEVAGGSTRAYDDEQLLTMVQRGCFRYYWDAAHPSAGMAIEILPGNKNLVALGGSGFGVTALVVGAERGFAPREQVAERMVKIVRFLKQADRFHGVWPHFLDGQTGRVNPFFGKYDNGGDLVETAFMMQGLLAARSYFDRDTPAEREIRDTVTELWNTVEWDWYRRTPDSPVLYWHWSPDHAWHIQHPLIGWNETMIIYLLAIASPTHPVPAEMFHTGFAGQSPEAVAYRRNWSRTTDGDHYVNGKSYYGYKVDVGCGNGGELFFNQFSFLGFDPRGKRDRYANYFRNNRNIALISQAYSIDNPRGHKGYGADCWGRSAGINSGGGRAQPRDDNGTICCSAALGVFPFTPKESMAALKHFYRDLGPKVWGVYGFHDGFNETQDWFDECYMGLNQAQIVTMIENHRTGLVWKHFMANPEIGPALERIGFVPDTQGDGDNKAK